MSDFRCTLLSKNQATKLFTDNGRQLDLSTFRGRVMDIAFEPNSPQEMLYSQFEQGKFISTKDDDALVTVTSKKLDEITVTNRFGTKRHVLLEASLELLNEMEKHAIADVTKVDTMETLRKQLSGGHSRG